MSELQAEGDARYVRSLTYREARRILDAAIAKAEELGIPVSVAVLDLSREPKALARMDGARLMTGEMAMAKAYTAVSFRAPSADYFDRTQPGATLFGLAFGSSRPIVTFGGGLPLLDGAEAAGAIGVSGGATEEDVAIAGAGAAVFTGRSA